MSSGFTIHFSFELFSLDMTLYLFRDQINSSEVACTNHRGMVRFQSTPRHAARKGPPMTAMKFNTQVEPPDTLTADHVVALNMRIFRKVAHYSMKQVGEQLAHYTGQTYTPQSISYWENSAGKENARPCTTQELFGLSRILNVPVTLMVTVPEDDRWLNTPVKGVDNSGARILYQQFTEDQDTAEAFLKNSSMMVPVAIVNSWTLRDTAKELGII